MKNLVIISAPSGAGKTTICRALQENADVKFSISCTTRERRNYEVEGVDYYFITDDDFQYRLSNDEFVETENVHGFMYGTLKESIDYAISAREILLFEVDVKGAMSIKNLYPEQTISIFILPPSFEDLKERLIKRGTDSRARIAKRLERLDIEIGYKDQFDYTVINDSIFRATSKIISIINKQNEGVLHVNKNHINARDGKAI
ncbi:MAG: guanylate kinase [Fidelibacterota bacterium]